MSIGLRIDGAIRALLLGSALVCVTTPVTGLTTPLPAPAPGDHIARHYARLCNPHNFPSLDPGRVAAASEIERSASARALSKPLHMITYWPFTSGTSSPPHALLADTDARDPHWYLATLDPSAAVTDVVPADAQSLRAVGYIRFISAYEYLNELLEADDAAATRCASTFEAAYLPTMAHALSEAIRNPGAETPAYIAGVQRAFATFVEKRSNWDSPVWTAETQRALGPKPKVELVYRDHGFPGDGVQEIDIVRLGSAPYTYALITMTDGGKPQIAVSPLCVTGDSRCASTYEWP